MSSQQQSDRIFLDPLEQILSRTRPWYPYTEADNHRVSQLSPSLFFSDPCTRINFSPFPTILGFFPPGNSSYGLFLFASPVLRVSSSVLSRGTIGEQSSINDAQTCGSPVIPASVWYALSPDHCYRWRSMIEILARFTIDWHRRRDGPVRNRNYSYSIYSRRDRRR